MQGAPDANAATQHVRVLPKARRPEAVADHNHIRRTGREVAGLESAAEQRSGLQHLEDRGRELRTSGRSGPSVARGHVVARRAKGTERRETPERLRPEREVAVPGRCDSRGEWIPVPNGPQAVIGVAGQRRLERPREVRRRETHRDAHAEREDGCQVQHRVLRQRAQAQFDVEPREAELRE